MLPYIFAEVLSYRADTCIRITDIAIFTVHRVLTPTGGKVID